MARDASWTVGQDVLYTDSSGNRHEARVTGVGSSERVDLEYEGGTANAVPLLGSLNYVPRDGNYFEPPSRGPSTRPADR